MTDARTIIGDWLLDSDVELRPGQSINMLADAIIAALSAQGLVIVPREPTEAMKRAYHGTLCATAIDTEAGVDCWRAMIAAATPPGEAG